MVPLIQLKKVSFFKQFTVTRDAPKKAGSGQVMSLSRYVESLTRRRLLVLACALCWIAVVLVAGGPVVLAQRALAQHFALGVAVSLLGSAALAVLLVECLRGLFSPGGGWTERRHFTIMGMLWVVLALLSVLVVASLPGS